MSQQKAVFLIHSLPQKKKGREQALGLSVVYGVIQEHHGFISIDSKVGEGTTFYLYLPVPQEEKNIRDGEIVKRKQCKADLKRSFS